MKRARPKTKGTSAAGKPAHFNPVQPEQEHKQKFLSQLLAQYGGNSGCNQRQRIVEALARFSLTTPEIRRHLDVMEVATRVWELRNVHGHNIDKIMVDDRTDLGRKHKVALYTLIQYVAKPATLEHVKAVKHGN